jgi:hypothetical protein
MATGILATGTPSATTATTAYVVPNTTYSVVNVSFTNTGTTAATIRLYIGTSLGTSGFGSLPTGSLVTTEAIEYDTVVAPKGVFERTGLVLSATSGAKYITVYASTANVNVNIYGIETSTV